MTAGAAQAEVECMAGEAKLESRWMALLVVSLASGCSDGSGDAPVQVSALRPPHRAAVSFSTFAAPGLNCSTAHDDMGFPSDESDDVIQELECDLSQGCKPDTFTLMDGGDGAAVSCVVSQQNDANYHLDLDLVWYAKGQNQPSVHFTMVGQSSSSGGTVTVEEWNSATGEQGKQSDCKLSIAPPTGLIGKGKIWGSVECNSFMNGLNLGASGCELRGKLLFEDCVD